MKDTTTARACELMANVLEREAALLSREGKHDEAWAALGAMSVERRKAEEAGSRGAVVRDHRGRS